MDAIVGSVTPGDFLKNGKPIAGYASILTCSGWAVCFENIGEQVFSPLVTEATISYGWLELDANGKI